MYRLYTETFKEKLRHWIVRHSRSAYAPPFLFLFSLFESIFLPLPTETVLTPLVIVRHKSWWYYALIATVASVAGGVLSYLIGVFFFDSVGAYLVSLYGLETELAEVGKLFEGSTFVATFLAAFTPLPWKLFAIASGLFSAPFGVFLVAAVFGRGLRFFIYTYVVHLFGAAVARLVLKYFTWVTIAAILIAALVALPHFI